MSEEKPTMQNFITPSLYARDLMQSIDPTKKPVKPKPQPKKTTAVNLSILTPVCSTSAVLHNHLLSDAAHILERERKRREAEAALKAKAKLAAQINTRPGWSMPFTMPSAESLRSQELALRQARREAERQSALISKLRAELEASGGKTTEHIDKVATQIGQAVGKIDEISRQPKKAKRNPDGSWTLE